MIKLSKGLLSFLSGLGFMGLCFYVVFFLFFEMEYKLMGNYILLFSILTSVLGCIVIYFLAIAFSFTETRLKIDRTKSGFIGGILTMVAIILMILSFRIDDLNLMDNISLFNSMHPVVTFFLAAACTILLIWPEELSHEYVNNRL
jgi:hypothetical protein